MSPQLRIDGVRSPTSRSERGSVAVFGIVLIVVAAVGVSALVQLGDAAVRRARVEVHADVAALAMVSDGAGAASTALARSGAQLIETTTHPGDERTVVVELGGLRARATAAPRGEPFGHDR